MRSSVFPSVTKQQKKICPLKGTHLPVAESFCSNTLILDVMIRVSFADTTPKEHLWSSG